MPWRHGDRTGSSTVRCVYLHSRIFFFLSGAVIPALTRGGRVCCVPLRTQSQSALSTDPARPCMPFRVGASHPGRDQDDCKYASTSNLWFGTGSPGAVALCLYLGKCGPAQVSLPACILLFCFPCQTTTKAPSLASIGAVAIMLLLSSHPWNRCNLHTHRVVCM